MYAKPQRNNYNEGKSSKKKSIKFTPSLKETAERPGSRQINMEKIYLCGG